MEQNKATKADLLREVATLRNKLQRMEEEQTSLQNQLTQALKMDAVGRLAGRIAHDFNNLLTTIIGYSELILSRMSKEAPFRMEMSEILKVGERAAYLTQQLLEFNRKQVAQPLSTVFSSASKEAQDTIHSGYETILLVEDDAALARPLQRLGYTILEADGITEAIRICAQYSSPIHLLLADIALLGMSGIELYANLREIHTEMKALIMSSHSKEAMPHQDVPVEEAEFIQKPFKTGDLALRLRTILDHR